MSENAQQFSAGDALGKAQDYASGHGDQVSGVIDKAQEALSNATGGKFDGAIEKGADMLEDKLGIPDEQAPQAEQTGSAPQEGTQEPTAGGAAEECGPTDTTAPEAPVPGDTPVQDPSDPAAPSDPTLPSEPSDPSLPSDPSVQPSGEPGTTIPTEPGVEPQTEPGYGGGETGGEQTGQPAGEPDFGQPATEGAPDPTIGSGQETYGDQAPAEGQAPESPQLG